MRADIQPRIVAETENVEIIKSMVASGLGISIVPFQSVAREITGGTLRVARIEGERLVRETGWVHLRAERVPRMVQEMMDSLGHILPRLRLSPQANPVPGGQGPLTIFCGRVTRLRYTCVVRWSALYT